MSRPTACGIDDKLIEFVSRGDYKFSELSDAFGGAVVTVSRPISSP